MSYAIRCHSLGKNFRNYLKQPGVVGALKAFVRREYRDIPAVQDFSFEIEQGEMVGLLGPNGAGKTTLMKILTGIIAPSSGSAQVLGYEPFLRDKEFRRRIALVMGQKSQLWWDIPALDSFLLLRSYYEISKGDFEERLDELSELLGVKDLLQIHVRKLSLGERMKMELMACLLHRPDVIFLDEPTIGLDLIAQKNIRKFVAEYQKRHRSTVILTSHYMADVEALCSRLILILGGRKRFDGRIEDFEGLLGNEKFVSVSFAGEVNTELEVWSDLHPRWNDERNEVELRIPEERLREVAIHLFEHLPVLDFSMERLPIERVMETLITRPELIP